ncbi:phosphotransferase [Nocardia sp. R7R-8]|uniref:phosphotransferase n=1 Tax=Nocardia sp. R7R-8 TaxID=3459304 RepID=UPI00403DC171
MNSVAEAMPLTAESLTAALRTSPHLTDATAITVTAVAAAPVGAGQMATSHRLTLSYDNAATGGPTRLVAKLPSQDEASLAMVAGTGAYLREVLFYQEIAPASGLAVPRCHHAWVDETTTDFVLLLEDLTPAATVDQLAGCSADQAHAALTQAADLHGSRWGRADAPWLRVEHVWGALADGINGLSAPWLDRFGKFLNEEQVAVIGLLGERARDWVATLTDRRTVWHGDFRADNLLFDARNGQTPVAVVDWQSTASGPGITDVSYFLGTSVEPDVRRCHEHELVTEYHRRLTSHGRLGEYSVDDCWLEYRAHALYGLVLTVAASMGVQATERGDAMFGAMAGRAASQVSELDSYSALDRLRE